MKDLIKNIISSSIKNLFNNQPDILTDTSQTTMTEWNLAHHLANEIAKYIFWLNNDFDISKKNYKNRRPDIIFHKRGINELNFLVIELKRNDCIEEDIKKIKQDWMGSPLFYRFGASVVIKNEKDWNVILFEREDNYRIEFGAKENKKPLPLPINETMVCKIKFLVNQIYELAKSNNHKTNQQKQEKVKELENGPGLRDCI